MPPDAFKVSPALNAAGNELLQTIKSPSVETCRKIKPPNKNLHSLWIVLLLEKKMEKRLG
jgi:hypothetical protein